MWTDDCEPTCLNRMPASHEGSSGWGTDGGHIVVV